MILRRRSWYSAAAWGALVISAASVVGFRWG